MLLKKLLDEGKNVLLKKAVVHFRKQMECFYYSISQLVCNMAK